MPVEDGKYRIWSLVSKKFLQLVEESKDSGISYKVECTGEGTEEASKARSKRRSTHVPNLNVELGTAE